MPSRALPDQSHLDRIAPYITRVERQITEWENVNQLPDMPKIDVGTSFKMSEHVKNGDHRDALIDAEAACKQYITELRTSRKELDSIAEAKNLLQQLRRQRTSLEWEDDPAVQDLIKVVCKIMREVPDLHKAMIREGWWTSWSDKSFAQHQVHVKDMSKEVENIKANLEEAQKSSVTQLAANKELKLISRNQRTASNKMYIDLQQLQAAMGTAQANIKELEEAKEKLLTSPPDLTIAMQQRDQRRISELEEQLEKSRQRESPSHENTDELTQQIQKLEENNGSLKRCNEELEKERDRALNKLSSPELHQKCRTEFLDSDGQPTFQKVAQLVQIASAKNDKLSKEVTSLSNQNIGLHQQLQQEKMLMLSLRNKHGDTSVGLKNKSTMLTEITEAWSTWLKQVHSTLKASVDALENPFEDAAIGVRWEEMKALDFGTNVSGMPSIDHKAVREELRLNSMADTIVNFHTAVLAVLEIMPKCAEAIRLELMNVRKVGEGHVGKLRAEHIATLNMMKEQYHKIEAGLRAEIAQKTTAAEKSLETARKSEQERDTLLMLQQNGTSSYNFLESQKKDLEEKHQALHATH